MELTGPAAAAVPILILLLGLSAGSFLNAVIRRLLREGRSFCPPPKPEPTEDGRPVGPAEGRRRDRRRPVSARYLLVEAAGALLAFYLHQRYGLSGVFLLRFCIALCLLAIALIDLELMIIPTAFVYPAAALSLMSAVLEPEVSLAGPGLWVVLEPRWGSRLTSLAGALAGLILGWGALKLVSVIYTFVRGHDGLGDGDPPL
jgi:leader peptidase (prepilin peptidase)/N-methyltransferase